MVDLNSDVSPVRSTWTFLPSVLRKKCNSCVINFTFQVFKSVVFSIFVELCSHYHCLVPECVLQLQKIVCAQQQSPPCHPSPQPPRAANLVSVSVDVPVLTVGHKPYRPCSLWPCRPLPVSIMFPRFIHVVAYVSHGLLFTAAWYSILSSFSPARN